MKKNANGDMCRLKSKILILVFGILLFPAVVFASTDKLNISQIMQKGKDVYLYVNVLDDLGKPVTDLISAEQFSVQINNGKTLPVQSEF